jgi:2-isopropylmalate synthase
MMDKVLVFDTTLRDGEQAPGCSMNIKEKLEVANQLARLGVDIIEAGFPISSVGDFEAVKAVAEQVKGPVICGLARAREEDVVRCGEAIKHAQRGRIHTFIATSDVHLEKKLRMTKEQVIDAAVKAVKLARTFTDDVEFSCEDAGRTDWDYMCEVIAATIEAGATTINIPDTVGYCSPSQFGDCIRYAREHVKNIGKAIISVHCHNDLGLAVANSLAGIVAGARQVECTINGLGERAGNASLEEIVMNLQVRKDFYKCETGINTREIYRTSRLVSQITGVSVQRNKAIVGANAFAHEAGIHQDGVLKEPTTYEIMTADSVGWTGESMVMGKHSGRHAFKKRLEELGFRFNDDEINRAFARFKDLCDKKKEVFDEDVYAIVDDEILTTKQIYQLEYLHTTSGTTTIPTATVKIRKGDEVLQDAGNGDGPIDAAYNAIRRITGMDVKLEEYAIEAATGGEDAVGRVTVKISLGTRVAKGRGASTDIILASIKAYINALNVLAIQEEVVAEKKGM